MIRITRLTSAHRCISCGGHVPIGTWCLPMQTWPTRTDDRPPAVMCLDCSQKTAYAVWLHGLAEQPMTEAFREAARAHTAMESDQVAREDGTAPGAVLKREGPGVRVHGFPVLGKPTQTDDGS